MWLVKNVKCFVIISNVIYSIIFICHVHFWFLCFRLSFCIVVFPWLKHSLPLSKMKEAQQSFTSSVSTTHFPFVHSPCSVILYQRIPCSILKVWTPLPIPNFTNKIIACPKSRFIGTPSTLKNFCWPLTPLL